MEQSIHNFKLIVALLKAELSINAMLMALSKAGFRNERNICGLHTQLLELTGFSEHEIEEDELLDFYVTTLDRLTEENLLETTENIHEVALTFYETLTAKRDTTGK